ncbi:MAG: hypothetical protein EHM91_16550, partial [Planctomycetota bacterium]
MSCSSVRSGMLRVGIAWILLPALIPRKGSRRKVRSGVCVFRAACLESRGMRTRRTIMLAGGSANHGDTVYTRAAREFGRRIAAEGWVLRTGGGSGGSIMGAASDGALEAGGRVEGVILHKFWQVRHRGLHSMRSYKTFALRKAALFRGAAAAAIFPGGYGTL